MRQPKILTRLKRQLRDSTGLRGQEVHERAIAYLQKCGNLKADGTATAKGRHRGEMTARERAEDRKRKYSRGTTVTESRR